MCWIVGAEVGEGQVHYKYLQYTLKNKKKAPSSVTEIQIKDRRQGNRSYMMVKQ